MLDDALKLLNILNEKGFQAYVVGGFVRDSIIGIESNDIDITTDATPKQITQIFPDSYLPCDDYGSVTVMFKNIRFELTTFRREISYSDHRRPDKVEYITNLYDDLTRRDFTINALCIDNEGHVLDFLNGRDDLDKGIIKCIGDADNKFQDDALRILRAIRFATILDFKLDEDVINSINKNKHLLRGLSYNRKKEELDKIFSCSNAKKGIDLLLRYNLDEALELVNLKNVEDTSSLISIWSILDVLDIYPFSNNEKNLIINIREVLSHNNLDPFILYKYGLYVNSVAADIKGIDKRKVTESYNGLAIHTKSDLDISSNDIMALLNKGPGPYLKEIYNDLINKVLYDKINNNKDSLKDYIIKNYS